MFEAPRMIGGSKVICVTLIDRRHQPTGNCGHIVAGLVQEPASGLAVCQYEGEDCFFLFRCDANWNSVTDSWHATLEEALGAAEFEYVGVSKTWLKQND